MTNKQILVLNRLAAIAKAVTGINYVGIYPEGIGMIGQKFPAVVIRDGDEEAPNYDAGQQIRYTYNVDLYLHHETRLGITRIKDILDLQTALITAIITDLTLTNTVAAVLGHSVSKGDNQNILLDTASGYQGEIAVRVITFNLLIIDTRS